MPINQDKSDPVDALPSSTIVIVRATSDRPELLMVKRRAGDAFGDSYTFPGGVVDDDEANAHAFSQGLAADRADRLLSVSGSGLDYFSTAIRELFEETGILLARDSDGDWANDGTGTHLLELRQQVDKGQLPWAEFLHAQGLRMAYDALHYFAHWETPFHQPKRWSTRFFLAELPPGQFAVHDGTELTDSVWLSASEALSSGPERGMKMPFPTLHNLKLLSACSTVAEMLQWATNQSLQGVQKILPAMIQHDGRSKVVMPGDADYPHDRDA
jgi:8-oxo-dGTP pyrophosphatase MutT (NUDIX family)